MIMLQFTKVRDVKSPQRGYTTSSGLDFFIPNNLESIKDDITFTPKNYMEQDKLRKECIFDGAIQLQPGMGVCIPSGLKVLLPQVIDGLGTYEMVLYNKSGVAVKQNLIVGAQVIDNEYTGEFNLHVINTGPGVTHIEAGQKLIQGIVRYIELPEPVEITEHQFNAQIEERGSERGEGKFGSSGTK